MEVKEPILLDAEGHVLLERAAHRRPQFRTYEVKGLIPRLMMGAGILALLAFGISIAGIVACFVLLAFGLRTLRRIFFST